MHTGIWTGKFIISLLLFAAAMSTAALSYFIDSYYLDRAAYCALILTNLNAFSYLYRYGTFARSSWRNYVYLFVSVYILALLFRMQHWQGGDLLLMGTWAGIALFYTIWFSNKAVKKLPDVLKWIWVMALCLHILVKSLHLFDPGYIGLMITTGILFLTYVLAHIAHVRRIRAKISEWDFDHAAGSSRSDKY